MSIERIHINSSSDKNQVLEFCDLANDDIRPASVNIKSTDWQNNSSSLMHKIFIDKIYDGDKAGYILYKDSDTGKILSGCGYHPFNIDPNIIVCYSRAYSPVDVFATVNHWQNFNEDSKRITMENGFYGSVAYTNEYNRKLLRMLMILSNKETFRNRKEDRWVVKMIGPYLIYNTRQLMLYSIHKEGYEQQFLNLMEQYKV